MASKRPHEYSDTQNQEDDSNSENLCKKPNRIEKTDNIMLRVLPLDLLVPGKSSIEPIASSSNSFYASTDSSMASVITSQLDPSVPCDSIIVPSDPNIAATLTSCVDLDIKEEMIDAEPGNSLTDIIEEPYDDDYNGAFDGNIGDDVSFIKKTEWTKDQIPMKEFLFTKQKQFFAPMPTEPYDLFRLVMNDQLLDLIVSETNNCAANSNMDSWKPLTREELIIFLGLLLHTGTIGLQRLTDYWNTHYLFNITVFSRFMSKIRFMHILDKLSFIRGMKSNDISQVSPIINHFNNIMNSIYYPGANLIVAKSISVQSGNILVNQDAFTTKAFTVNSLVDQDGIVVKVGISQGYIRSLREVLDLMNDKLNNGHSVYATKEYITFQVVDSLLNNNTYCTGPISTKLAERVQHKLKLIATEEELSKDGSYYGGCVYLCKVNNQFYVSSQHDGEPLHGLSSKRSIDPKCKPAVMYQSVLSLDLKEHLMLYYPCKEITLPWHKKVFIHILQLAMVNAFKFFKKHNKRLYNFRMNILEQMLPSSAVRLTATHKLTKIEITKKRERWIGGRLVVSINTLRKDCKGCRKKGLKRKGTIYECRQCEGSPAYCEECYEELHKDISDKQRNLNRSDSESETENYC